MAGKDAVRWRGLPAADRPFYTHAPVDYALDMESSNPPAAGASDGGDAGCIAKQLPTLPVEEPIERTPPRPSAPAPRNLDGS